MTRRGGAVLVALVVTGTGCGGEERADPVAGTVAAAAGGIETSGAAGRPAAPLVSETATSSDPAPTTAPTPADVAPDDPASELPDPCGLATPNEIEAFVEPGTVGAELDAGIVAYDPTRLRQCDWPGAERGLSIQLQAFPDLSTVTVTADAVAPIDGAGMEAVAVLSDDGETVVMVAFDTGDVQLVLFPWERIVIGSPPTDALVELGILIGGRI